MLNRQGQSGVESELIKVGIVPQPEVIETAICRISLFVVKVLGDTIVSIPPSSTIVSQTCFGHLHDFVNGVLHAGRKFIRFLVFNFQDNLNIPLQVGLVNVAATGKPLILFSGRIKLRVNRIHRIANVFQRLHNVTLVANTNQFASLIAMGHRKGVGTNNADGGKSNTHGQQSIVSIAQHDELADFVILANGDVIAIHLAKHPNTGTFKQAPCRVQFRLTRVDERLEKIESFDVLQRLILRTNFADNTLVGRTHDRPRLHGESRHRNGIVQLSFPIQAREFDTFGNRRGILNDGPQTMPRGFANGKHIFDCCGHCTSSRKD